MTEHAPDEPHDLLAAFADTAEDLTGAPLRTTPPTLTERQREWLRLDTAAKSHEAQAKALRENANRLQESLIEDMVDEMQPRTTVDGRTVYIHTTITAKRRGDVDEQAYFDALRENGLGDLVKETVHSQSLRSAVAEYVDNERDLPEGLAAVLDVGSVDILKQNAAPVTKGETRRKRARAAEHALTAPADTPAPE